MGAEQSARRFRETALAAVIAAGLGSGLTILTWQTGVLATHTMLVQGKSTQDVNTPMHKILPGVPYVERDGDVTQLCVANKAAWSLPPYVSQH